MDKDILYVCISNGILFSHKKKEILPFMTTWMGFEGLTLSEIRKKNTNTI